MKLENLQKANDIAVEIESCKTAIQERKKLREGIIYNLERGYEIEYENGLKGDFVSYRNTSILIPEKEILKHLEASIKAEEAQLKFLIKELEEL
jgi:hypothetical protein